MLLAETEVSFRVRIIRDKFSIAQENPLILLVPDERIEGQIR
jgi:hypothetical protein